MKEFKQTEGSVVSIRISERHKSTAALVTDT